jgi:MFS family permease
MRSPLAAGNRIRALLAERDFRVLIGAQVLAQAADGLAQAALTYELVLEPLQEGTPGRILGLFVLTLLPYSMISPFMGVFVDRWPRRGLLVWTNVVRAVLLISLPAWSPAVGGDGELLGTLLVILAFGRLFLTTKGAVLPAVLHDRHLLRGNALSAGTGMVAALAGGVIGVVLLGVTPDAGPLLGAGLCYAVAAWLSTRLSEPFDHEQAHDTGLSAAARRVGRDLVEGLRAIWSRAGARLPLLAIFIVRTIGMFVAVAAILVIKEVYPDAADDSGKLTSSALALGTAGAGAFAAAVFASVMGGRLDRPRLILAGFLVSGTGIVALGGVVDIYAVLGLTFVGGFGTFLTKVAVDAQVQHVLPDDLRGRAFALYDILYNLASIAAGLLMVTFEDVAFRPLLIGAGLMTFVVAYAMATAMRRAGLLIRRGS